MEVIQEYERLPKPLKKQLSKISKIFSSNSFFREKAVKAMSKKFKISEELPKDLKSIMIKLYVLKKLNPFQILSNEFFFKVTYCYDEKGNIINLKKIIKVGKHACVSVGYLKNQSENYKKVIDASLGQRSEEQCEVVVKWYKSEKHDISFECAIYRKLNQLGCPLPFFSTKFKFWNEPVLVIEKLRPIDTDDDPCDIGIHVLYQLFFLHKFGVHCDIKPQNIMKKYKNGPQYFLIDFGGVATESLGNGFRRWLWSPKWTSQKPHQKDQVVFPIHDLIELGFTMNYIKTRGNEANFKKNFRGPLLSYMKYIRRIGFRPVTIDYINLIDILRKKT